VTTINKDSQITDFDKSFNNIENDIQDIKDMIAQYAEYGCLSDKWTEQTTPKLRVIKGGNYKPRENSVLTAKGAAWLRAERAKTEDKKNT